MARYDLCDIEWRLIEPLLPNKPRVVQRVDDRRGEARGKVIGFEDGRRVARAEGGKEALDKAVTAVAGIRAGDTTLAALPARPTGSAPKREPARPQKIVASHEVPQGLDKPAQALLAEAQRRWPAKFTWGQLATLTGRKARGGSFNAAKQQLLRGGHVTEANSLVLPTDVPDRRPISNAELLEVWCQALPSPADQLLAEIAKHPKGISIADLAQKTNRQPRGGSWNGAISTLRSNALIREISRGEFVVASLSSEAA